MVTAGDGKMPYLNGIRGRSSTFLRITVLFLIYSLLAIISQAEAVPSSRSILSSVTSKVRVNGPFLATWPVAKFGRQVLSLPDVEEEDGEEGADTEVEGDGDADDSEERPLLSYRVKKLEAQDNSDDENETNTADREREDDRDLDEDEIEDENVAVSHKSSRKKKNADDDEDESDLSDTNNTDLDELEEPEEYTKVKSTKSAPKTKDSVAKFRGVELGLMSETNISRLSYMTFKLLKTYKIKSMVDMPCRKTVRWMPRLLERLDFEIVGFKYYCVAEDADTIRTLKKQFAEHGSPEFLRIAPEEVRFLPKVDLVFTWDGLQEWGIKRSWTFFNGLREARPKYVILSNNPGTANTMSQKRFLNVRKQPFHFRQAMRVVSNMTSPHVEPKQLLLYDLNKIRKGF